MVVQVVRNPPVSAGDVKDVVQEDPLLPTSVLLPGEFHGPRSLVGYSSWGHKDLDMTE